MGAWCRREKGRLSPFGGEPSSCGQGKYLAHSPTGEQNHKKRTYHVLPKPAKLISYRLEKCENTYGWINMLGVAGPKARVRWPIAPC